MGIKYDSTKAGKFNDNIRLTENDLNTACKILDSLTTLVYKDGFPESKVGSKFTTTSGNIENLSKSLDGAKNKVSGLKKDVDGKVQAYLKSDERARAIQRVLSDKNLDQRPGYMTGYKPPYKKYEGKSYSIGDGLFEFIYPIAGMASVVEVYADGALTHAVLEVGEPNGRYNYQYAGYTTTTKVNTGYRYPNTNNAYKGVNMQYPGYTTTTKVNTGYRYPNTNNGAYKGVNMQYPGYTTTTKGLNNSNIQNTGGYLPKAYIESYKEARKKASPYFAKIIKTSFSDKILKIIEKKYNHENRNGLESAAFYEAQYATHAAFKKVAETVPVAGVVLGPMTDYIYSTGQTSEELLNEVNINSPEERNVASGAAMIYGGIYSAENLAVALITHPLTKPKNIYSGLQERSGIYFANSLLLTGIKIGVSYGMTGKNIYNMDDFALNTTSEYVAEMTSDIIQFLMTN